MQKNQKYQLSYSMHLSVYITHNATQLPAVWLEIQVCYASNTPNLALNHQPQAETRSGLQRSCNLTSFKLQIPRFIFIFKFVVFRPNEADSSEITLGN